MPTSLVIPIILLLMLIKSSHGTCRVELTYKNVYGYGYGIWCAHVNTSTINTMHVYNELTLTVNQSTLALDADAFTNLRKLRELTIYDTTLMVTKKSVINLPRLYILTLNKILPESLVSGLFSSLGQLKVLNLQWNNIEKLDAAHFGDLGNLQTLNLSYNAIKQVDKVEICKLQSLRVLALSYNKLSTVLNQTIACLKNLEELYLDHNEVTTLDLQSITLNKLFLQYNLLNQINFMNITNLQVLNLEGNRLKDMKLFTTLPNLLEVSLSNNSLTSIASDVFNASVNLRQVDLSNNQLTDYKLTLRSLKLLNVSYNQLTNIDLSANYQLKRIDISHNALRDVNKVFSKLLALNDLNASHNQLSDLDFGYAQKAALKTLRLADNNFTQLGNIMFKQVKNLTVLDLSLNQIRNLKVGVFNNLPALKVLNISYNRLIDLNYEVFRPLENLQLLDIEGNLLKSIDYSAIVDELPYLDVINIRENLFSCEFLSKLVHYFKDNQINYTVSENFEFDKENVGGIYCKEVENKLLALNQTLISELYAMRRPETTLGSSAITGIIFGFLVIMLVLLLVVYRLLQWQRRRHYLIDELELINASSDPYKILRS